MSVKRNYLYNLLYQIFSVILPIITVPYITRVLGSTGIGVNAFTSANMQYFIIFASLGISLYGNRTIAFFRDDKEKLSNIFWSIFVLKLMTTSIAYAAFIIAMFASGITFSNYYQIQSINIIAVGVDISWLFLGMEDFKRSITRSIIVRIIGVVAVFVFVKTGNDLWLYILINGLSNLLGQMILWIYAPKIIFIRKVSLKDVKIHVVPSIKLFIPTIATQIYGVFDKTLLGYMSTTIEVGLYDMGQKIIYLLLTFVSSMGVVMLPKMTNIISKGNIKKVNEYIVNSFNFASYISIPMMFGIMAISQGFSIWFFGNEFAKSGTIMLIESPILVMIGWSNVIGVQYMLPLGKSNEFTVSVIAGAIVNIVVNLIIVKSLLSIGTSISTVLAEFSVLSVQVYLMRNILPIKEMFRDIWKYFLAGFIMFATISLTNRLVSFSITLMILQIVIGIFIYLTIMSISKSNFQNRMIKEIWNSIHGNNQ